MSAYICNPDHTLALAMFAAGYHGCRPGGRYQNVAPCYFVHDGGDPAMDGASDRTLAEYYAGILYAENIRSVTGRYPNDAPEELPGPIGRPARLTVTPRDMALPPLPPVVILKLCDGLEYQSCETDDWKDTLAHKLLSQIRRAAIRQLPGYDDAAWEYSRKAAA